jgi:hypothetical protein
MVRVGGVKPPLLVWKTRVIIVIPHPHPGPNYSKLEAEITDNDTLAGEDLRRGRTKKDPRHCGLEHLETCLESFFGSAQGAYVMGARYCCALISSSAWPTVRTAMPLALMAASWASKSAGLML